METRDKSKNKKNAADQNEKDDDPRGAEAKANGKDSEQLELSEKTKVNMEKILQEIRDFRQENNRQLGDIKEEINKTNRRIGEAEDRIDAVESRLLTMEHAMRNVLKVQAQHAEKLVDQEGRARRENIRLYNVPEGEEGSSMVTFVEKLLREKLNIPLSTELHIERAHRALGPKPSATGKPRSIVIKFLRYKTKEEVLRKAWEMKEIHLNNQRLFFDHDYPAAILNKRKEYNEVKRVLKEKKIRFQTPYPARLRVFYEDGTRIYNTISDATKDMKERGLPVTIIPPPEDPLQHLDLHAWRASGEGRPPRDLPRRADALERLQVFRRDFPS